MSAATSFAADASDMEESDESPSPVDIDVADADVAGDALAVAAALVRSSVDDVTSSDNNTMIDVTIIPLAYSYNRSGTTNPFR